MRRSSASIGRVTGGTVSQIDGTIAQHDRRRGPVPDEPARVRCSGHGEVSICAGRSHVSSADILFGSKTASTFSAIPASGEVLSAAAPSAWGFTSPDVTSTVPSRSISASSFAVPSGETLERGRRGTSVLAGDLATYGHAAGAREGRSRSRRARRPAKYPSTSATLSARSAAAAELGTVTWVSPTPSSTSPIRRRLRRAAAGS